MRAYDFVVCGRTYCISILVRFYILRFIKCAGRYIVLIYIYAQRSVYLRTHAHMCYRYLRLRNTLETHCCPAIGQPSATEHMGLALRRMLRLSTDGTEELHMVGVSIDVVRGVQPPFTIVRMCTYTVFFFLRIHAVDVHAHTHPQPHPQTHTHIHTTQFSAVATTPAQ